MKRICLFLFASLCSFSSTAFSAWKCETSTASSYAEQCARAGSQESPEALISAFVSAVSALNTNANRTNYKAGACTPNGTTRAICAYSWTAFGTQFDNSMTAMKEADACPGTLEVKGPNSGVTKSGESYYVLWSATSVTSGPDICHNSCSYLASSASGSTCYLSPGSTSSGFCNYVVGLNSASPSCGAESGYTAPSTGDPLTPNTDPGDGGSDGSDGGSGDGGNTGGGDGGGSGDSGFDGELSFSAPGSLDTDDVIDSERNAAHYEAFVVGMEADFNESGIGKALTEFRSRIGVAGQQGICPAAQISLLGTLVTFDAHCDLFSGISPILTVVFMAAWSLMAIRIFLSA